MKKLSVGKKSFYASVVFIVALMLGTYIWTLSLDSARVLPLYEFVLSPVLALTRQWDVVFPVLSLFLVLGGALALLEKSGVVAYILSLVSKHFSHRRYLLMGIVILFFMLMGSLISSYDECIAFGQIIATLAVGLGWDTVTGLCMCLLAESFGFASAITNSFSVGISQGLAGVPVFSGMSMRIVSFVFLFFLLYFFTVFYAKKIERKKSASRIPDSFVKDRVLERAMIFFSTSLVIGIALIVCSAYIPLLQDRTIEIVSCVFIVSGAGSVVITRKNCKESLVAFFKGIYGMIPSCILFLLASSIGYILKQSGALDIILNSFSVAIEGASPVAVIVLVYFFVLFLSFFVPSASAKAFMLMPILIPVCKLAGISANMCILVYAMADGLAKCFYPTCPTVLISISATGTSFLTWFKKTALFQLIVITIMGFFVVAVYNFGY